MTETETKTETAAEKTRRRVENAIKLEPRTMKTSKIIVQLISLGLLMQTDDGLRDNQIVRDKLTELGDEIDRRIPTPAVTT